MRYTTAFVLSTLAIGQAAAANNRHASFHSRRQTESKRNPDMENVNWEAVAYDYSGVDWKKVDYNGKTPIPSPVPAAEPNIQEAEAKNLDPLPIPDPAKSSPSPSAKPSEPLKNPSSDPIGDLVDDLLHGVESAMARMGFPVPPVNSKNNNGNIWIGDDSPWKANFVNKAKKDMVLYCWEAKGFSGMSLNKNAPAVAVGLKAGQKIDISFAPNVPSACAPAFDDTEPAMFGGVDNTWFETTFGAMGAFDVSRNVNMNGNSIAAKGSKCTSDMDTCVFKCTGNVSSCEKDYDLMNCGAGSGGGGGYDVVMQGTGGGCAMGADGETIDVTFT